MGINFRYDVSTVHHENFSCAVPLAYMDDTAELRAGLRLALSTIRKMRKGEPVNVEGVIVKLEQLRRTAKQVAEFKQSANLIRIRIEKKF